MHMLISDVDHAEILIGDDIHDAAAAATLCLSTYGQFNRHSIIGDRGRAQTQTLTHTHTLDRTIRTIRTGKFNMRTSIWAVLSVGHMGMARLRPDTCFIIR